MIMREIQGFDALKPIKTTKNGDSFLGDEDEDEQQPLSPMALLFHDPGFNIHIIAILGLKTKPIPDILKPDVARSFLRHPRFTSLQVVDKENGGMKWIPTKVDIDDHFIVPKLEPQDMDSPDEFIDDYISGLTKTPMDKSKPLWDIHLLPLKSSNAESTLVLRCHHSIGDGTSLMSFLLDSTRKASDPKAQTTLSVEKGSSYLKFKTFWSIFRVLWNSFIALIMFALTGLFLKDTETPLRSGSRGVENRPRRIVHRSLSLTDIKFVKNEMNITVNDVVLGITQAGLSRYLKRKYGDCNEQIVEKNCSVPKSIRLRAVVPFDLRITKVDTSGDMKSSKYGTWGNKIGYVLLPLNIAAGDNEPLDHLRQAKLAMDRKKASLEPYYTTPFVKYFQKYFGTKATGKINSNLLFNTTVIFSNVPGPREQIKFHGHDVSYIASSVSGTPTALVIHAISYGDKITFTVTVDETTIPDPHRLSEDLEESLHLFKASLLAQKSVKEE